MQGCEDSRGSLVEWSGNDIQVLGSHNSYKEAIDSELFSLLLELRDPTRIRTLEYEHPSLSEQLDLGLRKLELDVFYDLQRLSSPNPFLGLSLLAERGLEPDRPFDPEPLSESGFKVLHVQDLDFRTNCVTLRSCLEELREWSDRHPRHLPITVSFNTKDDDLGEPWMSPLAFGATALDELDLEIRSVLTEDRLILPDDVRGDHPTLREAVLANAWPTLDEARGKFLFILDQRGDKLEHYRRGHPSLADRVMFVNADEQDDEAAVRILNDPIGGGERIRALVEQGFLVRTRSDADTQEARSGEVGRRDAAFASGAQFVSTDYYRPSQLFESDYRVTLPGGAVARCNPVRVPAGCAPRAWE